MSIAAYIGIEIPRWMDDARCKDVNPQEFFPSKGVNAHYAKALCAECPVAAACLATALADPSVDGVWGGTTSYERMKLRARAA